ncbi:PcfJ domain-containing protein [Bacteroides ihuae]|uniref:PcfJ domain-containing protein n=1 Tax=Bacteroides ihuae TaxID=1852362 RepID=UPI0008D8F891|nr:PcfJ domain-containing protein [Bacteroides ihuae]
MKPKTKLQKQVAELSTKLPALTDKQRKWAIEHCFEKEGYLRKKSVWCTECGHTWEPFGGSLLLQLTGIVCPHCGKQLKIESGLKRKSDINEYYTIITCFKGFQVLRHFVARKTCRVGYPANYEVNEAVQNWITSEGKETLMYRSTKMSFMYIDLWDWGSPLEIRTRSANRMKYDIFAQYIYPVRRYIPSLTRNGFKGRFHGISPLSLFKMLLSNSKAETLIKSRQYSLLKYLRNHGDINCWPSVRICLRNNYIVKDASMWIDYILMLTNLGKDVRNAKYACPSDLRTAHDKALKKVQDIKALRQIEENRKDAAKYEDQYRKMKAKFLDLEFTDGLIKIAVLHSVQEFLEEGATMRHCVFGAQYYTKEEALILSARIGDKRIETVEVNLKTLDVVQSRGVCNKSTEYHDRIVGLVKKNINLIRQKMTA